MISSEHPIWSSAYATKAATYATKASSYGPGPTARSADDWDDIMYRLFR